MNNKDRIRLLTKMHQQKSFRDWLDLFMYLAPPMVFTIPVLYHCISNNNYSLLNDNVIRVIVAVSITLSVVVVYLWYRTPRIHLLGSVLPEWHTAVSRSLKSIGYDVTNSKSHYVSFYKGPKHWFGFIHTNGVIIEDNATLYACIWKGTEGSIYNISRDIGYSGRSEIKLLQKLLQDYNKT